MPRPSGSTRAPAPAARRSLGREQVVTSNLGRWVAQLTVPLHTPAKIRAMRSLLARLDGRTNAVRVGPCDCRNGNRLIPAVGGIPYDDDRRCHIDGAGFMQGGALRRSRKTRRRRPGTLQITIEQRLDAGCRCWKVVPWRRRLPLRHGRRRPALPDEKTLLDIRPKLRTALRRGSVGRIGAMAVCPCGCRPTTAAPSSCSSPAPARRRWTSWRCGDMAFFPTPPPPLEDRSAPRPPGSMSFAALFVTFAFGQRPAGVGGDGPISRGGVDWLGLGAAGRRQRQPAAVDRRAGARRRTAPRRS